MTYFRDTTFTSLILIPTIYHSLLYIIQDCNCPKTRYSYVIHYQIITFSLIEQYRAYNSDFHNSHIISNYNKAGVVYD